MSTSSSQAVGSSEQFFLPSLECGQEFCTNGPRKTRMLPYEAIVEIFSYLIHMSRISEITIQFNPDIARFGSTSRMGRRIFNEFKKRILSVGEDWYSLPEVTQDRRISALMKAVGQRARNIDIGNFPFHENVPNCIQNLRLRFPHMTHLALPPCTLDKTLGKALNTIKTLRGLDITLCRKSNLEGLKEIENLTEISQMVPLEHEVFWQPNKVQDSYHKKSSQFTTQEKPIDLGDCFHIEDSHVEQIVKLVPNLQVFDCGLNFAITDKVLTTFAKQKNLRQLSLCSPHFNPEHIKLLHPLRELRTLCLGSYLVDHEPFQGFRLSDTINQFPFLERLYIQSRCGAGTLACLKGLKYLHTLSIRADAFRFEYISELKALQELRVIGWYQITKEDKALLENMPQLRLIVIQDKEPPRTELLDSIPKRCKIIIQKEDSEYAKSLKSLRIKLSDQYYRRLENEHLARLAQLFGGLNLAQG